MSTLLVLLFWFVVYVFCWCRYLPYLTYPSFLTPCKGLCRHAMRIRLQAFGLKPDTQPLNLWCFMSLRIYSPLQCAFGYMFQLKTTYYILFGCISSRPADGWLPTVCHGCGRLWLWSHGCGAARLWKIAAVQNYRLPSPMKSCGAAPHGPRVVGAGCPPDPQLPRPWPQSSGPWPGVELKFRLGNVDGVSEFRQAELMLGSARTIEEVSCWAKCRTISSSNFAFNA